MSASYRRFMILSSPRSGTHMLSSALAEHPSIVSLSEVFNPDFLHGAPFGEDTSEEEILERHVFCEYPPDVRAVGFALHRAGARFGRWPTLWQRLERDVDLHVICLSRLHLLGRYLSYRRMREKGAKDAPIRITPRELKAEFRIQETLVSSFDERFAHHPVLHVKYEQLLDRWEECLRRIQGFLGVEPLPLRPTTQENPSAPYREQIENYDELARCFADTSWSWLFARAPAPRA